MFLTSRHTYGHDNVCGTRHKIRFALRSSGKIKFLRLWFPCDSVTLLCIGLKRKDKYHCSMFSGHFRIWGYWFSIYFLLGYCALCWIDQTLNSLVPLWFLKLWVSASKFLLHSCPQHLPFFYWFLPGFGHEINYDMSKIWHWISFWFSLVCCNEHLKWKFPL